MGERDSATKLQRGKGHPEDFAARSPMSPAVPGVTEHGALCPVGCKGTRRHSLRERLEPAQRSRIPTSNPQVVLGWWRRAELGGRDG